MARGQLMDWMPTRRAINAATRSGLFSADAVALARAPGRLDVMGGIADYMGSLVCEMPLAVAAVAVVQPRNDGQVVCYSVQSDNVVKCNASRLATSDPDAVRKLFDPQDAWARYPIGCWWHLSQRLDSPTGCTILIDSDVPLGGGVSSSAAIEVATMTALLAQHGITMSPMALAAACQSVENRIVGAPCGVMDQVTSCLGRHGCMIELLCQPADDGLPAQALGDVHVPPGYAFIGIHSGVSHDVSGDPYTDTRVAAFMAQRMLSELDGDDPSRTWLANLDADAYLKELRGALPESISGAVFLGDYGHTNDPVTSVRSDRTYHVRAAADHHVLEMSRVRQFIAHLRAQPTTEHGLRTAGALMLESHRSYGDNARLGHPMTDRIVEMAMTIDGVYGAKITGGGCGGTVAVLLRDHPDVLSAIEGLRSRYTRETGRSTLLFQGTSPGASSLGSLSGSLEDLS